MAREAQREAAAQRVTDARAALVAARDAGDTAAQRSAAAELRRAQLVVLAEGELEDRRRRFTTGPDDYE